MKPNFLQDIFEDFLDCLWSEQVNYQNELIQVWQNTGKNYFRLKLVALH